MIKKNYKKIILLSAAAIAGTTFTIPVLPIHNVTAETVVEEDSSETTIVDKRTDVSEDCVTDNESYSIDENITLPTGDSLLTEDSEIKDSDEALSDIQKDAQDSYDSNYDESENSTEEYKNFSGVGASNATNNANEIKANIKNGWIREDGGYKYYKNGKAYTGWHMMGSAEGEKTAHWSYFGADGKIYTGWHYMSKSEGEKTAHWSFFGDNGWLRTGWVQLGKGTSNPDGNAAKHWSYFGSNGWLRTEWVQFGKGTSEPDGNSARHWSYFGPNGWLRTGWQDMGKGTSNPDGNSKKHRSYFGDNGWLRTGTQVIGGKSYRFDDRGWLKYSDATVPPKEDPEEVWTGIRKIEVRLNNGMHLYLPSFRDDFQEGGNYPVVGYGYRTDYEYLEYYNIVYVDDFTNKIYSGRSYFSVNTNKVYAGITEDHLSITGVIDKTMPENTGISDYIKIAEMNGKVYYIDFSMMIWDGGTSWNSYMEYFNRYADKIVKSAWVE